MKTYLLPKKITVLGPKIKLKYRWNWLSLNIINLIWGPCNRRGWQRQPVIFIFFNVCPPKEDIFSDHLLWAIFQSSLHTCCTHVGPLWAAFMYCIYTCLSDLSVLFMLLGLPLRTTSSANCHPDSSFSLHLWFWLLSTDDLLFASCCSILKGHLSYYLCNL